MRLATAIHFSPEIGIGNIQFWYEIMLLHISGCQRSIKVIANSDYWFILPSLHHHYTSDDKYIVALYHAV